MDVPSNSKYEPRVSQRGHMAHGPKGTWGYSSAGRALAWHARGQRFDPAYLHQRKTLDQSPSPSSRGLGHRPFTAVTRVRISLGTPKLKGLTNPESQPAALAQS